MEEVCGHGARVTRLEKLQMSLMSRLTQCSHQHVQDVVMRIGLLVGRK